MLNIAVVLYEDFELLDVFGPLEMFGLLPDHFAIHLLAQTSGSVKSAQGPRSVIDATFDQHRQYEIVLVPGGCGSRIQINNTVLLNWIRHQSQQAQYVASVCTGSALLATAGVLDGLKATTNKLAFDWVSQQGQNVNWVHQARWVQAGKYFTSSGVSAGMDMSLGLIAHLLSEDVSRQVAIWAEYEWHNDPEWDPFANLAKSV